MKKRYVMDGANLTHQQVVENILGFLSSELFGNYHMVMGRFETPMMQIQYMGGWLVPAGETPRVKTVRNTLEALITRTTEPKDDPNRLKALGLSLTAEEHAPHLCVSAFPSWAEWHFVAASSFENTWCEKKLRRWYQEVDAELRKVMPHIDLKQPLP